MVSTKNISIIWELVRKRHCGVSHQNYWIRNLFFNKPSRWFRCMLKSGNLYIVSQIRNSIAALISQPFSSPVTHSLINSSEISSAIKTCQVLNADPYVFITWRTFLICLLAIIYFLIQFILHLANKYLPMLKISFYYKTEPTKQKFLLAPWYLLDKIWPELGT